MTFAKHTKNNNNDDILAILMPDAVPAEVGYLWSKYGIGLPGVQALFYCANSEIAVDEVLTNQIKTFIQNDQSFFIIFPQTDTIEINGSNSATTTSFAVVHYGTYNSPKAQAIARTNTVKLMEMFREKQNRWISRITIGNTDFQKWSQDGSTLQQYTTYVTVTYREPYLIGRSC